MSRRDWYQFAAGITCSAGSVLFAYLLSRGGRTHKSRR